MSVITWLSWIALVLAIVALLVALAFIIRGVNLWQRAQKEYYTVGKQTQRRTMVIEWIKGSGFILLAILLTIAFTSTRNGLPSIDLLITLTPTITPIVASATPTLTSTPTPTLAGTPSPSVIPTTPIEIPTRTLTPIPTISPTPEPPSAIVNSPNGLYLRPQPGSDQIIELIPDQTDLVLVGERVLFNDLQWQKVLTPLGNEGWVAADFLIYPIQP